MKPVSEIKILVVEDDPFYQRVLNKRLAADGYKVLMAADGREGMKAIVTFEPDLVISDWMMPEVDGLELCQSVKTGLGEKAPYFILLTAKGEISSKLLGLEKGADDYLVKPCDQGELMARVRAGLRIVLLAQDLRRAVAQLQIVNKELGEARGGAPSRPPALAHCAGCGRVHGDDGEWRRLADIVTERGLMAFTPEACPRCLAGDPARPGPTASDGKAAA